LAEEIVVILCVDIINGRVFGVQTS
jgi:hypothetical protein